MIKKCISAEAKNFENKLTGSGITYNKFVELQKMWNQLTLAGQAEVNDILKVKKE